MILNENYIFMFINAKYIKEYNISADYVHPIFISGFDDEKKVFYASDYFSYIYKTVSVPFGELKDGFFYAKEEYFLHEDYLHGITLYQKGSYRNQEYSSQERTENAIFESISWAINPTNFKGQLIPSLYQVFGGIYAQRCLCQYLYNKTRSLLCESQHKLLAILVEHKKVMNLGIDYLAKNSRISNKNKEEFCKIYEKYRQLLFRYLYIRQKYGGDNSQNLISEKPYDLIVKLDELTRCEEMFYMEIIKCQN